MFTLHLQVLQMGEGHQSVDQRLAGPIVQTENGQAQMLEGREVSRGDVLENERHLVLPLNVVEIKIEARETRQPPAYNGVGEDGELVF